MFSKTYLHILMDPLVQHLLCHHLNLNGALLLLSSIKSIISPCLELVQLQNIAINFLMFSNNHNYILLIMHKKYYINILSVIYLCIIYFGYPISKWSTIFKYYFLISIIYCHTCNCCIWQCHTSFSKYLSIAINT